MQSVKSADTWVQRFSVQGSGLEKLNQLISRASCLRRGSIAHLTQKVMSVHPGLDNHCEQCPSAITREPLAKTWHVEDVVI